VRAAATVLIADDSLVVRAVVRSHLEEVGYRVLEAEDGLAAIDRCRREAPDVLLLDIEMPGLDGHEVLARLKADPGLRDIPVVFLTNRSGMTDVVAGLDGGAHDYLKKPFEAPELVARVAAAAHVRKLQDQLRQRSVELERVSRTDPLTGLPNRRDLQEECDRQHGIARRHGDSLGLILLDIDHFKNVNDAYGHPVGDLVLREFARRLSGQIRAGDIAGRWGGEEFLVVLPRTGLEGARAVGERIRAATSAAPVVAAGHDIAVTVSGGCAIVPVDTPDALVAQADALLYLAKAEGRDRIVAADGEAVPIAGVSDRLG
jgi:two-component system cell cycle response regulator